MEVRLGAGNHRLGVCVQSDTPSLSAAEHSCQSLDASRTVALLPIVLRVGRLAPLNAAPSSMRRQARVVTTKLQPMHFAAKRRK